MIKKRKIILGLEIFGFLAVLIVSLALVEQRQELRKRAYFAQAAAWFDAQQAEGKLIVSLSADFNQAAVTAFNFKITYSPDQLNLTEDDINLDDAFDDSQQGGVIIKKRVDQIEGAVYLAALSISNGASGVVSPWVSLNFTSTGTSQAEIRLVNDKNEYPLYEVVGLSETGQDDEIELKNQDGGHEITITHHLGPEPTESPAVSPSPTPSPTPTILPVTTPTPTSPFRCDSRCSWGKWQCERDNADKADGYCRVNSDCPVTQEGTDYWRWSYCWDLITPTPTPTPVLDYRCVDRCSWGKWQCERDNADKADGACRISATCPGMPDDDYQSYWRWSYCWDLITPTPTPTFILDFECETGCSFGSWQCERDNADKSGGYCRFNPLCPVFKEGTDYWRWSYCHDTSLDPTQLSTLSFKIKFQGIADQQSNQEIKVILKQEGGVRYEKTVVVEADNQGIYSGQLANLTPGTYDVYIKGWAHLTKKFTDIKLVPGNNEQDWTEVLFLAAGDFNGDNVLDIHDVALLLQQYTGTSVSVNEQNRQFDVNLDGQINIFDLALVLQNWTDLEVKGD